MVLVCVIGWVGICAILFKVSLWGGWDGEVNQEGEERVGYLDCDTPRERERSMNHHKIEMRIEYKSILIYFTISII